MIHTRKEPDYIHFLKVARGSLMELQTQVLLSERLAYLQEQSSLTTLAAEVDRILQALIRGLERKQD